MRANIYSLEPLFPEVRDAVHDGLGMVAAHIGEAVSRRELLVKLPMTPQGTVNGNRVGIGKLDPMVEMHLMAVPLHESSEQLGMALVQRGVGFTDITSDNMHLIRSTAAHETAHALGFVTDGHDNISLSKFHCADDCCVMHPSIATSLEDEVVKLPKSRKERWLRREAEKRTISITKLLRHQYDFCFDCKSDMRSNGTAQLDNLRQNRLFMRKGM